MPIITINILEGRSKEQKTALIKNVSAAVIETLQVQPESVRVMINEMTADHYGIAGLPVMEYRTKLNSPSTFASGGQEPFREKVPGLPKAFD